MTMQCRHRIHTHGERVRFDRERLTDRHEPTARFEVTDQIVHEQTTLHR